jgi:hypothetical protein
MSTSTTLGKLLNTSVGKVLKIAQNPA